MSSELYLFGLSDFILMSRGVKHSIGIGHMSSVRVRGMCCPVLKFFTLPLEPGPKVQHMFCSLQVTVAATTEQSMSAK